MLPARIEVEKIRRLLPFRRAHSLLASFSARMAETEKQLSAQGEANAARFCSQKAKEAQKNAERFAEIHFPKSDADR